MSIPKNHYSDVNGYCLFHAFDLNSGTQSSLGEPPNLPADSFLIDYSHSGQHFRMLIDAGKKGQGEQIIIPSLFARGIDHIDQLFISHMHRDHYGGVIDLLNEPKLSIGEVIMAPIPDEVIATNQGGYPTWKELEGLLQERASTVRTLTHEDEGLQFRFDPSFSWQVISLPNLKRTPAHGINDLNLVLKVKFRQFNALFPGDCGIPQAEEILQCSQVEAIRDVSLLKAAHHGKGESLSSSLIAHCNAKIVLMSSNAYVATQHSSQLMEHQFEYGANGAKVYRLDEYQGIDVYTDGLTAQCVGHTKRFTEKTIFENI